MTTKQTVLQERPLHIRIFLAGIYSQLAAGGTAGLGYILLLPLAKPGTLLPHLGSEMVAYGAYILTLIVFALVVMKRTVKHHWLRISTAAIVSELVAFNVIQSVDTGIVHAYDSTVLETIVIMLAVSAVVFLLSWKLDTKLDGKLPAVPAFLILLVVTVGATNGILFPIVNGLSEHQRTLYRNNETRKLNTQITNLKFDLYIPKSLPTGYTVLSIVPYDPSSAIVPEFNRPQSLTFTINSDSTHKSMSIVELKASSTFKPPTYCGPYQAGTLVEATPYPVPCQEVLESGKIKVYLGLQTEFSSSPPTYDYYLRIGVTEIILVSNDAPLSDVDLKTILSGLKEIKPSEVPQQLLQQY